MTTRTVKYNFIRLRIKIAQLLALKFLLIPCHKRRVLQIKLNFKGIML